MANNAKWYDRFMKHYMELTGVKPDEKNALIKKTHRGISQIAALRCAGLDARKIAMFAADAYDYVLRARQLAIEEVAKIAVKETEKRSDRAASAK